MLSGCLNDAWPPCRPARHGDLCSCIRGRGPHLPGSGAHPGRSRRGEPGPRQLLPVQRLTHAPGARPAHPLPVPGRAACVGLPGGGIKRGWARPPCCLSRSPCLCQGRGVAPMLTIELCTHPLHSSCILHAPLQVCSTQLEPCLECVCYSCLTWAGMCQLRQIFDCICCAAWITCHVSWLACTHAAVSTGPVVAACSSSSANVQGQVLASGMACPIG